MKQGKRVMKTKPEQEKTKKNKLFVVRKRQVAAVGLMLLIGVAGYLNLTLSKSEADPGVEVMYQEASKKLGEAKMVHSPENGTEAGEKNNTVNPAEEYFANARLEREKKRGESIEMLTGILNSTEAEKTAKEHAESSIARYARFTEQETQAENMIRAKGYGECVVFMGENVTTVAVEAEGLNEMDAAVITDIVAQGGEIQPEQVKIVEIKPN